jgi:hypothetical protein
MKQFFLGFYAVSFSAAVFMAGMFIGRWIQREKTRRRQASVEIFHSPVEANKAVQKENKQENQEGGSS